MSGAIVVADLPKYDLACRAIAAAKSVDEAKDIADKYECLRAYARQARNRGLEIDAAEIRVRAERRAGEIIIGLRREGKCGNGACGPGAKTFEEMGIKSSDAAIYQNLGAVQPRAFDRLMKDWRFNAINQKGTLALPLGEVRKPAAHAYQQRRSKERATKREDEKRDDFSEFKLQDGRKIGDILYAHLHSLFFEYFKTAMVLKAIKTHFAHADSGTLVRELITPKLMKQFLEMARIAASRLEFGDDFDPSQAESGDGQ